MKSSTIFLTAAALAAGSAAGAATNIVANGSFEQLNANAATGKYHICDNTQSTCQSTLTGWSATGSSHGTLGTSSPGSVLLDGQGGAQWNSGMGFWGNVPNSPDGGNFIAIDGDSNYSQSIFQTINGLTIGKIYTLNFWQAAAQQHGLNGPTTEQWQVSFGGQTQLSTNQSNPSHGIQPWTQQTMTFKATSTSQVLTFLALGTPNGLPPAVLLDGVSINVVPEPASWAMLIPGFGLIGVVARRRRTAVAA